jgi:hypothetical protein
MISLRCGAGPQTLAVEQEVECVQQAQKEE